MSEEDNKKAHRRELAEHAKTMTHKEKEEVLLEHMAVGQAVCETLFGESASITQVVTYDDGQNLQSITMSTEKHLAEVIPCFVAAAKVQHTEGCAECQQQMAAVANAAKEKSN